MITGEQLDRYQEQGYLVLNAFVSDAECDELRARAEGLVQTFDPAEVVSIL